MFFAELKDETRFEWLRLTEWQAKTLFSITEKSDNQFTRYGWHLMKDSETLASV